MKIIEWDWKDHPPWDRVNLELREYKEPVCCPVETGSDAYAVVVMGYLEHLVADPQKYYDEHKND